MTDEKEEKDKKVNDIISNVRFQQKALTDAVEKLINVLEEAAHG